ncbi:type I glyceraldehyde-3-phosphate dehydrogenase [Clostridium pasteurianum]|uniref:type I glyceraldehyde-3-phosphate dehydrogenase n=1 Tax=Clostridium pasteurianum TaxID=1501 RepID=UPI002260F443|nr:glyceraldehyde 3-phosphate dehydrogenase NAD-binding domain-containing protein [Clostridium pasteurianum]UZW15406.1 type I glyceraldehyde-3-phosphate dehydrogenase [Clostridium pasteurianum]
MGTKIAINGFGRIGRLTFRQIFDSHELEVTAINDITDTDMLSYLLKYDTTQGTYRYANCIEAGSNYITVNKKKINVYNETDAVNLPWKQLGIDVVIDCSGAYLSKEKAQRHIKAGAKIVLLSAPAGSDIPTVVYGVNHNILLPVNNIISAASCSTNALAPVVKTLNAYAPIQSGIMTVVHGFTGTQMLVDGPQRRGNYRRSRAASSNIVPTTAEAAKAVGIVIPDLRGKLMGSAVRVPVPIGCYITFTAVVCGKDISADNINKTMKGASSEFFGYTEEEYVSSDIIGNTYASIFDATQTLVIQSHPDEYQVRVSAWFDNENSFVSQMVRILKYAVSLKSAN